MIFKKSNNKNSISSHQIMWTLLNSIMFVELHVSVNNIFDKELGGRPQDDN